MKCLRFNAPLVAAFLAAVGTASAGGFSRGTADTDLIFDEGDFDMRAGVTIVAPQRGYATVIAPHGAAAGRYRSASDADGKYSELYAVPTAAVKFNVTDDLRLRRHIHDSRSAQIQNTAPGDPVRRGRGRHRNGARRLYSNEFGATCGYKFDLAKGRAWIIGGAFPRGFRLFANGRSLPSEYACAGDARRMRPATLQAFDDETTSRASGSAPHMKSRRSRCVRN